MLTRDRMNILIKEKNKIDKKIEKLQEECEHPNKISGGEESDHDGWSGEKIKWWEKFHCPDCDKYWPVFLGTSKY